MATPDWMQRKGRECSLAPEKLQRQRFRRDENGSMFSCAYIARQASFGAYDGPMLRNPSPVRIRIRSASGDFYAMGPGKAELLTAIRETGSIAAAGRRMDMSYQKTRQLVDELNQSFTGPLVEGFKGGTHGGGARLTDLGEQVLGAFLGMQKKAEAAVRSELEAFRKLLAP